MTPEIKNALVSMGYRVHNGNQKKWAKPIAHMVFTVELDRNEITLWFTTFEDTRLVQWWSRPFLREEDNSPTEDLVKGEADLIQNWRGNLTGHVRIAGCAPNDWNFSFLPKQESEFSTRLHETLLGTVEYLRLGGNNG